ANSALTFTTTSFEAGGYQLQVEAGTYQVTFSGDLDGDSNIDEPVTQQVTIGSQNVKLDVVSGTVIECFLAGTRILTDRGEVPVEELHMGDRVQTADGTLEPIKWIGKQTIQPNQVKNPLRGYPILIKAGALGDGLPYRALYTSPDHALLVEGLLINAGALVNGVSILKTTPTEPFTYYHIELHQHSLLVAEGTAAESYLPQRESRDWYDNGAEYKTLYPNNGALVYWPMQYPRVSSQRQMPRYIHKKLMVIAKSLGQARGMLRAS
ncbi:MAG: Hint domain-containing protein, partial [Merismopedia sp. SIO2A8]|nr:Hint domain-containing protein [Merismopedia sp. SIO2A8]